MSADEASCKKKNKVDFVKNLQEPKHSVMIEEDSEPSAAPQAM